MAARNKPNVPVTLLRMHSDVEPIYKKLLSGLKKERDVRPSELSLIATYANLVYLNEKATFDLIEEGSGVVNKVGHGEKLQDNPSMKMYSMTVIQMEKYSKLLGMSPKALMEITGSTDDEKEDEEDDPLSNLMKKRGKK